ncbi:MAG: Peptidase rane alanine aminopeptidase [Bryobacterales bacterium]|nr:Peptidase rane alanine aminopeptidase [Bryobacterales bacterium]
MYNRLPLLSLTVFLCACSSTKPKPMTLPIAKDIHSFSNPQQIAVRHADLDLSVIFDQKTLQGTAVLWLDRTDPRARQLVLDTRDLQIDETETSHDNSKWREAPFHFGKSDKILGRALAIDLPADARFVRIRYSTDPSASGLQWLSPAQTAGKQHPFLFSQSEPIAARSWIPLQDSPGVRMTYSAHIKTPAELTAVMSAEHDAASKGDFRFHMNEPIPPYLIAISVGDLAFQETGKRTGVYAEPSVVAKAAKEFEDTEKMIEAAERLFGPYRWGRYDLLVLPPSFPFGGMENPRLTFATPTVLAGDKSLVSLVAHELAHSWSGNLVTNATWRDFWLNEGFTVYIERRIQEEVYGRAREGMEAALGRQELEHEMAGLDPKDQVLHIDLAGRDPDDGMTLVPYEKGALLLRQIEETFGRERFDKYLRGYFDRFAFQSITTAHALAYMHENLFAEAPELAAKIPLDQWVNQPGLPPGAPDPKSDAFGKVQAQASAWVKGTVHAAQLQTAGWTTQEWLHFLRSLPDKLSAKQMAELDAAFHFTASGNDEILQQWLVMSVRNGYAAADEKLGDFLLTVGRRKYIKPLYEELVKTPAGKQRAASIYERARPGYHPMAQTTIDGILR